MISVRSVVKDPLRAIWQALQAIARYDLHMTIGIHHGPCIVGNMNDRLDYFGSMVNIAARLTEFSTVGEIVLSEAVYEDSQIQAWLEENRVRVEKLRAKVKGFDEPVSV